jgi:hypothetical protein
MVQNPRAADHSAGGTATLESTWRSVITPFYARRGSFSKASKHRAGDAKPGTSMKPAGSELARRVVHPRSAGRGMIS